MVQKDKIYLSPAKLAELKNKYQQLLKIKRPKLIEKIAEARKEGDLSENSAYIYGRQELVGLDAQIEELRGIISKAVVTTNNGNGQKVAIGGSASVESGTGEEFLFFLVGELEANPAEKKISIDSPLGKALLGKKVGERVEVQAPVGKMIYTIRKIN